MKKETRKLQGERLRVALKCRHKKHADIYNKFMTNYDPGSAKTIFSYYLKGEREIPTSLLKDIASELNIPFEYLQGVDNFETQGDNLDINIQSFYSYMGQKYLIENAPTQYITLFDLLFDKTGLRCLISPNTDDTDIEFSIYRFSDSTIKNFAPKDMERFIDRICAYVIKEYDTYMDIYYSPKSLEEYREYIKQHPKEEGDADD